jgi:protein gp37
VGERTGIAWADSTRNFWSGCTKVGPGCDGCYAEAFNRWTRGKNEETGEAKNWGPKAPRVPYLEGAARDCEKWNKKARDAGQRRRVFINTFSDTFDNAVPQDWRTAIWNEVSHCEWLDFLLVTKRIGNVAGMVPHYWMEEGFPSNVRLLITVVNQEEADRDVPKLLALPCKNGISYEPALGPVDWSMWLHDKVCCGNPQQIGGGSHDEAPEWDCCGQPVAGLQWIIVGGESKQAGHEARPFNISWARQAITQCQTAGVPVFIKQLGSVAFERQVDDDGGGCLSVHEPARLALKDPAGEDPAEWPEDLRVREFPK